MNEKVNLRRLEWSSFTLLLVIAIAIALLFSETLSLNAFKIILAFLLFISCIIFWLLRVTIAQILKEGKQRLRTAEFKFEKLLDSNLIGVLISDHAGVVLRANDAFLNMLGYSKADLADSKILWNPVSASESTDIRPEAAGKLENNGNHKPVEKYIEKKDGSRFWVLCGSSILPGNKDGESISYVIDISNQKAAEEMARKFEDQMKTRQEEFESVFMNAPALITIRRGTDLRFVFVNNTVRNLLGVHNFSGKSFADVFKSDITRDERSVSQEVYKTGQPVKGTAYKIEYVNDSGNQRVMYLDYMLTPVFDHKGKVDGVAFFGNDVTELVTAIQDLKLSQNKFAFLADTMPHQVWITNAEGEVQYLNKAWMEYANIQSIDRNAIKWSDTIHPDESDLIQSEWKKSVSTGTEFHLETRFRRYDGEYRWHLTHAVPFKDTNGTIVYWVGINTDIHDQKMQLEHLKHNEAYFRELSEETPFIVWKSDRAGKCIYLNKKWVEVTGLSVDESLGNGYRKALLIDDFEAYRQNWIETLKTRSLFQDKFRIRTVDGSYRWFFSQANPHYINSVFYGYVGSLVDITEQELSSQAIQELSEKKDEFLSIASHELKTPLTSIKASIQVIARAISPDNKVSRFAVKASEQLLRLERLISDLLDVSKINSGRLVYNNTVFYFREMLDEVVQSIQSTTHTHQIIIQRSDKVIVLGDRFRLEQVIYNFLSNAVKYSPDADKVILTSEVKENNLIVSVQDFGIGIAEENLAKTFDRYYRVDDTAMRFQGLGLGLFISAEIIKRHHGHFWIESEPGKGSTFFFSLPLNDIAHVVKPETDHQTYYKDSQVDVWYDPEKHWIESNWHGFQNFASIKHGCLEMLSLLEKNCCFKILNDNTHVLGNWADASNWGAKVWLPAMEKAGLRYFAWVHSESTFSRLAASKIEDYTNTRLITKFFDDKEDAIKWLDSQTCPTGEEVNLPRLQDKNETK